MQPALDEFRTVVLAYSSHSDKFHELGENGKPACGETADREWRPVPVFVARQKWFEACERLPCRNARDR